MKKIVNVLMAMALIAFAGSALADDQGNLSKALKTGKDVYCNSIRTAI